MHLVPEAMATERRTDPGEETGWIRGGISVARTLPIDARAPGRRARAAPPRLARRPRCAGPSATAARPRSTSTSSRSRRSRRRTTGPPGLDHVGAPLGPRRPRGRARGRRGRAPCRRRVRARRSGPSCRSRRGGRPGSGDARGLAQAAARRARRRAALARHAAPASDRHRRTAVHTADVEPPRSCNTQPPMWMGTGVTRSPPPS